MTHNNDDRILKPFSDDDDDSEFSLNVNNQTLNDLENELEKFRCQWKSELLERNSDSNKSQSKPTNANTDIGNEKKATYLFNKAVILEQQGRLYEDIENKVSASDHAYRLKQQHHKNEVSVLQQTNEINETRNDNVQPLDLTLYDQFQSLTITENKICEKNHNSKVTHFSNLPYDCIIYILKWVVSDHLDMRSLDTFSSVCKGFYVCARDKELWRLACAKIWPNNCNSLLGYSTWRAMYLERKRLNFDGCYISKATYARAGEPSLDHFYRPWHLVEYYRYLRFFPNGTVVMLTSPDEPKLCVGKFKTLNVKDTSIIKGKWILESDHLTVVLVKNILKHGTGKYRRANQVIVNQELVYNMEFQLTSFGKKNNFQLKWLNYDLNLMNKLANTESFTTFEITKTDFPPFFYSRVKSYASGSEEILK